MERRIAAIIRWLERFQNSYRAGALENALMDAECARADLENLRLDVWARIAQGPLPRRLRVGRALGVLVSMSLIVLATASPLAKGKDFSAVIADTKPSRALQAPPKEIQVKEVEPPSMPTVARLPSPLPIPAKAVREERGRPQAPKPVRRDATQRSRPAGGHSASGNGGGDAGRGISQARVLPEDKVFSLIQTGNRALKNEDPVIKIHRR